MKNKRILLITSLLLFINNSIFAWSREGHHMVAEIAYQLLSKSAKEKLTAYLGSMSLDDAATWMDDQRGNNQYRYLTTTHYINIEKGEKMNPFQKNNIYTELNSVISELEKSGSVNEGKVYLDLLILIHLVGDIHQPLHDGYGNDKGGNSINVSLFGKSTNLHSAWDGGIIYKENITTEKIMSLYPKLSASQVADIKKINIDGWVAESRNYLDQIYSFQNSTLDQQYVQKATPIIENQILKAGIRLSAILETVLGGNTPAPAVKLQPVQPQSNKEYTASEASAHIGEKITVCDKVYGTRFLENSNGQPTFLNLGAAYPASPFTVVIFGKERENFKEKPEIYYNNKKVCITGSIKEYNGKSEMILTSESEIKIVN